MTEGEASGAENRGARLPVVTVVVLVATCAGIYVISQFLRGSIGVIAPNLARELSLNAAEIGLLSSLFFLMFAAAQLPLGIALDRFGPRACLLGSVSLAIAGSLLFALAGSFAGLLGARVLMGLGCAALLMAPLAVYARWFPPDRFSTLLGIQMAVGSLGALLATAPLARAAEAFGWRTPFLVVAAITVVSAVVAAVVVRDNPPGKVAPHNKDSLADSIRGVVHVIRIRDVWRLFLLHTCAYAMYASIQGLWGGPYLTDVYGFELAQRGDMLLLMAVAQICGSFLWGISDRLLDSYRWPTMIGAIGSALLLLVLPLAGPLPQGWLPVWFAAFGLMAAFTPVMMAHGKSLFPPHLVGRGITLLNLANMGGVFVWQAVAGVVVDLYPTANGAYPAAAYHMVFALQGLAMLALMVVYVRARDPRHEEV
ncbi:MFS transporter [Blastochloris tepida]|uniref:Lysosomal dipeptide transporter MFSD1 n=1 Tax=Blastochloris tepida TaxID=2233851 RepID=A0A348G1Y0_9HYPH|nr:MFS transporter [Blastochloris tepida]BBF93563.1 MFS transporter [Blastochloris tepida]